MLGNIRRSALERCGRSRLGSALGRTAWRRRRLLVLCYHGVTPRDEHEWNPALHMSRNVFARRLSALRAHGCAVLPLSEAVERLYRNDLPERAVALTFDDGFHDFHDCALPLLAEAGYPATVYLTTQRCEHNLPIARLLVSYLLWVSRDRSLDAAGLPGLPHARYALSSPDTRAWLVQRMWRELATRKPAEKDVVVREIARRLGRDYDVLAADRVLTLMNPDEVRRVAALGSVDIQLHTHRHKSPRDAEGFRSEVTENRRRVAAMTGTTPTHFCYPSGVHRKQYLGVLAQEGIRSATTCAAGMATAASNPLLLPRVLDSGRMGQGEFEAWLTGAAAWAPRSPAILRPAVDAAA